MAGQVGAHGIVDNEPFRPTQVFAPDDNPIYVWFRADGCTTGTTIKSVWFYLETDPPLRFSEGAVTVDRLGDWGQFNFELAPGKRWSTGEYRIDLSTSYEASVHRPFVDEPAEFNRAMVSPGNSSQGCEEIPRPDEAVNRPVSPLRGPRPAPWWRQFCVVVATGSDRHVRFNR